jgi:glycosyltransferase involved in cell wall biosynthesis
MEKVLFIDQSSGLGGAELCLLDIAQEYRTTSAVGLFAEGDFCQALQQLGIPHHLLTDRPLNIRKDSAWWESLRSSLSILKLVFRIVRLSRDYDVVYANTQKAFVMSAIAAAISRRPLVFHLHDILSTQHFSPANLKVVITLANWFASLVIANSDATQKAFIESGGKPELVNVVYNGFHADRYPEQPEIRTHLRQELKINDQFVVGCFSRLSPWKGQHVLLAALAQLPKNITVLLVGDALYGEDEYVQKLHDQIAEFGLADRVKFLGFRSDVPQLMQACDVIAHTSTNAEPFGRVIVEAMLSRRPVIATAAGGAVELIRDRHTGWLVKPGDVNALTTAILEIQTLDDTSELQPIIQAAYQDSIDRFSIVKTNHEISSLLKHSYHRRKNPLASSPASIA